MNGSQEQTTPTPEAAEPTPTPAAAPQLPRAATQAQGGFYPVTGQTPDPRAKSPVLACFLSVMPGLGQVYTGFYLRGFVYITTVAGIITLIATGDMDEFTPFLAIFLAFFWLHNCIDAARRATFYNQLLAGGTDTDVIGPEMKLPGTGGSLVAGIVLIVAGAIALSYTKYDMSLAWLEDLWPLIPIGFGIYLVAVNVYEKTRKDDA